MLDVAINGMILRRGFSGSGRLTTMLWEALRSDDNLRLNLLAPEYDISEPRPIRACKWALWDLLGFGMSSRGADIVISPTNFVPIVADSQRLIAVVHDVIVLDRPERFDYYFRQFARVALWVTSRRAAVIVAPSEYSRTRIEERLHPRGRVEVIPQPVPDRWFTGPKRMPQNAYVLTVAATEPHKRLHLAIKTVALARETIGDNLRLVMVGPKGRDEPRLQSLMDQIDPGRLWIERRSDVTDEEILVLYQGATLLLHTSEEEGFGYPLVEAAATGTPIVFTAGGAASEVLHPHVEACPPDVEALAPAIVDLLSSDETYWAISSRVSGAAEDRYRVATFADRWRVLLQDVAKSPHYNGRGNRYGTDPSL